MEPYAEVVQPLRLSMRSRQPIRRLDPTFIGQTHGESMMTQISSITHPDKYIDRDMIIMHACITQVSMKRGLRKYNLDGERAVIKEIQKLHLREKFHPIHHKQLSGDEMKQVLESHLFL